MRQNSDISDIISFAVSLHQLSRYKKDVLTIDAQEIVAEQEATASTMIPMDVANGQRCADVPPLQKILFTSISFSVMLPIE